MTESSLENLFLHVTLSQATDLAHAGRYSEAETLLSNLSGDRKETPGVLDLLARIRAQQGRLLEAEAFWRRAAQLDPANEAYHAGLRRIAKMQSRPVSSPILPWLIGLSLVLSVAVAALTWTRNVTARLAKIESSLEVPPSNTTATRRADLPLKVSGMSVQTESNDFVITFDNGLFSHGTVLKADAKTMLTALGLKLEAHVGQISVQVVGHTDDVPIAPGSKYRDNVALGMERALAVVGHLRATSRLPSSMFSIRSLGESLTPYPNDTLENRARNRTVVIRVTDLNR